MAEESQMPDAFDRLMDRLADLPDVVRSRPTTVESVDLLGNSQTFVITTVRQRERGDTIFIRIMDRDGGRRYIIPPKAAAAIHRQADGLTTRNRSKAAKQAVQTRQEKGLVPFAKKAT